LAADYKPPETDACERRADTRLMVNVPVEITEISDKGRPFTERTVIENISDIGCRFSLRGAVQKGDTVAVRLLAQDGKTHLDEPAKYFEVMWTSRGTSGVTVGARFLPEEKADAAKLLQRSGDIKIPAK
jgi:PilZ domain